MLLLCVWFIIAQNKTSQPNSKAKQNKSPKQNHKTKQTKISKQNSKVKTKPQNKTAKQKFKLKAKQNNTAWNTGLLFAVYWSTKKKTVNYRIWSFMLFVSSHWLPHALLSLVDSLLCYCFSVFALTLLIFSCFRWCLASCELQLLSFKVVWCSVLPA